MVAQGKGVAVAVRSRQSAQGNTAVLTAGFVLVAWLSSPALAAPDRDVLCDDREPAVSISATELSATPVNNNDELLKEHLLKPRAESAVRSAFADDAEKVEESETEISEEESDVLDENSVVPSAFGREPSPFKRQMYRRDI